MLKKLVIVHAPVILSQPRQTPLRSPHPRARPSPSPTCPHTPPHKPRLSPHGWCRTLPISTCALQRGGQLEARDVYHPEPVYLLGRSALADLLLGSMRGGAQILRLGVHEICGTSFVTAIMARRTSSGSVPARQPQPAPND